MTDRIVLGFAGGLPIIRISRPGKEALSSNPDDLLLTETSLTFRPSSFSSSRAFSAGGTANIPLSGFSRPPYVLLKSSDGTLPQTRNYYARINAALTTLTIYNRWNAARTIFYYVFANTL